MHVVKKLCVAALVVLATGVPVLDTWEALLIAVASLALVFGACTGWRRVAVAAGVVVVAVGIKALLPRADIAEAHNPFLVINDGEPLQQGLPPQIFASWRARFDAMYPPDKQPGESGYWRHAGVPKTLYTPSADAIWRTAKYSRQVDDIDFRTLGEFRGGFANEHQYNWWTGDLRRESMPFYVMYELTEASVGSSLEWKGQVFWERGAGEFEEIVHPDVAARDITQADVGKRLYAAFFSTPGSVLTREKDLYFRLEPSLTLRLSRWMENLLTLFAVGSILVLTVRPRWPSYLRALATYAAGYAFMAAFLWISLGKYLGKAYPPQGGGDDGMAHDGWGRMMAMLAGHGHVVDALQGFEPVYWFTPGTRYLRMIEKLIFGDTNLLFALLVPCVPIVLFYLFRHFLGARGAWVVTVVIAVMPAGNLSYLQYISNAKLGYGEAIAAGLFVMGLVLMLRTQVAWGGSDRNLTLTSIAGASLAASMFLRPNFALAVVWLGTAYAWASLRRRDAAAIAALAAGLAFALWLPFHNWYYGGEFYLISKSGATISVPVSLHDYVTAARDLASGQTGTPAVALTTHQVRGWLWNPGFVVKESLRPLAWALHMVKLFALLITCGVVVRWARSGFARYTDLGIVAVTSLWAHAPMLFVFNTHFRYAMLGWDLNLVVLIVCAVRLWMPRRWPRRRRNGRLDVPLPLRSSIALTLAGAVVLSALGITYALTKERAPSIRVRWRADVSDARRVELERRYLLSRRSEASSDAPASFSYDLLDTRRANIEALVRSPEVADTNDIDRQQFVVRPGTAPGREWMWAAHRMPGLRDAVVRETIIITSAIAAGSGIIGIWLFWLQRRVLDAVRRTLAATARVGAACRGTLTSTSDAFDLLPTPDAEPERLAVVKKLIAGLFVVLALGVPILATWKALVFGAAAVGLIFSVPVRGWWSMAAAAAVLVAAVGAKAMLPRADIAEAHNAFLVLHDGEALERGLPPEIFKNWRAQFDALYPAANDIRSDFSWRTRGPVPAHLYTASADAIWRRAKYTRQVDAIDFRTLGQFRGGFANENDAYESNYNFWTGQVRREAMPFYAMYELTPASVGSRLEWSGQLFWQTANGGYEEIVHEGRSSRVIAPADAGRRVYAVFFPDRGIDFRLIPSVPLRASALAGDVVSLAAVAAILGFCVRFRWSAYARALVLSALAFAVIVWYQPARLEYLAASYPPHPGGDDGMAHDGWGRLMAMLLRGGRVGAALEGHEPIYWFTPGTRYVRMVEKLIFGDTNHLWVLQLAAFPIVIFYLVRQLLGTRWAWGATAVFLLMPVGNFSLLQYAFYAGLGYGEAWAAALFLTGLALLLRTQPRWGGADRRVWLIWCAGAALALSMFIRPNFAIAVVWLGAVCAWTSWRQRDWRAVAVLALGLAVALWMPLHNWLYGGELYLISKSGSTISLPIGAKDYASAVTAALGGDAHARETGLVVSQLKGWLLNGGYGAEAHPWAATLMLAVRLLSLATTIWVAVKWSAGGGAARADTAGILAIAALLAHAPMLFVFDPLYRYAVLAWDLSILVMIVAVARSPLMRAQPRAMLSRSEPLGAGSHR